MTDRFFALKLFSRVARLRSFSQAAQELGLSQPSASRIVSELEKEIGAALLTRTTRGVVLTEGGKQYLERVDALLDAMDEADHAARGTGELRGVLRVSVATSFAIRVVVPSLPAFMDQHPALKVSLQMSDQFQDLINENIDVALRFGVLADSAAVARTIGHSRRMLVAAPGYLKKAGVPKAPSDLLSHSLIVGPAGSGPGGWAFKKEGRSTSIRPEGRVTATVNEGATVAAIAGLGILFTGDWGCRPELADGTLIPVLPDWQMDTVEINAIFPAGRAAKRAARAFVDHLAAVMQAAQTG